MLFKEIPIILPTEPEQHSNMLLIVTTYMPLIFFKKICILKEMSAIMHLHVTKSPYPVRM